MRGRGRTTQRVTITETPEPALDAQSACLVVIAGPMLGVKVELNAEPLIIGRSDTSGLTIPHPSVSRQHCRIMQIERGYWLEDLGSTNRTYINGKAVDRVALNDGDRIKLGDNVLKFFDAGSVEANYQKQLVDLAVTDELTGLSNRRHFVAQLNQEMQDSRRHNVSLALLIGDLDHFKPINDTFGHLAGDKILRGFAELLQSALDAHDAANSTLPESLAGRLGGEEFGILLPEVTANQALVFAEKLRAAVAAKRFNATEQGLTMTISIGVAMLSDSMETHSDFLRAADEHMYEAKNKGRNQVVL
jgi:diguanylate cyclase (GGDEF)-like protein